MDLVPLLFLLVIVFASGGIALVADVLGRKLGKKRLWLKLPFLHLRPKHTAQTGVFLSGVCVSFLTILIVAGLSKDVRTWILEGQEALVNLQAARDERQVAEEQVNRLESEGRNLGLTNKNLKKNLDEGNRKLGDQTRTINDQKLTLDEQQRKISQGSAEILALQVKSLEATQRIAGLNEKIGKIEADYRKVNAEYQTAKSNLQSARVALKNGRQELARVEDIRDKAIERNGEILARNAEIENKNRELENSVRKLEGDIARLDLERSTLEAARNEFQVTLEETVKLLRDSNEELASTQQEYTRYQLDTKFLTRTFLAAREAPLTYQLGQEVARVSVPEGATADQAKQAIAELIKSARKLAAEAGAKPRGGYDAADIVDHFDHQMGRRVTAHEIEASLVRQLTGLKGPQVIVGSSSLNAFAGEPVSLEVSIYPNPLVYKQGQIVAEAKVDGKRDQSEIFRQVETLLAQRVAERAKQDKMIPLAGTDAGFGVVTRDEILDVMDRVRKADRKVTLRAIAEVDTRAGDPLRLRFGIR